MQPKLMQSLSIVAASGIALAGLVSGIPSAAADDSVCTSGSQGCAFYSPSRNISCEINTGGRTGPDSVYCQTNEPAQSVTMDNTGAFHSCTGVSCLGNAGQGTPTLAYGQTAALGPFKCLSDEDGVSCTAAGRGFMISRSGVGNAG